MRNSKKVKGFTLVELIVVIAIIAILAAILVPNMLSYIKQSRYTQADANAKNVHTAATAALAQAYVDGLIGEDDDADDPGTVSTISAGSNGTLVATVGGVSITIDGLDPASFDGNGAFAFNATTYAVTAAAWAKTASLGSWDGVIPSQEDQMAADEIIGYYPSPVKAAAAGGSSTGSGD
ncbi:MAG: prepilin-type N-terminal cleavage/methylation domain-containing protein [Oscillospiraceae bacterium]|nr:prepilin-type N-terminal cleavage/methylation domain-containing protein [Oscillospiraceae bacterium]